jgi:tetratricopeptide (TPR) repeat protein
MKRLITALCAALFLAACSTPTAPTREAREHYENGQRAYKAENNAVAESEFAGALSDYPDYAEAALQLAYTRYRLKKYELAREDFLRSMKLYANAPEALDAEYWAGMCDYSLGYACDDKGDKKGADARYKPAEAAFSSVISRGYTANDVFAWRAWTRVALGIFGKAQSDFRRAIKFTSNSAKKKEWQEAVDNINKIFGEAALKKAEKERQDGMDAARIDAAKLKTASEAYAKAKEQFEREQFGVCRVFCERALELEAGHEEAKKLLKQAEEFDWK